MPEEIAYFLATVGWETAWLFAPRDEIRAKVGTNIRKIQDRYWGTGYFGRGYIQLTWKENYQKMSNLLSTDPVDPIPNLDLVNNPHLLLQPSISYRVAADGMRKGMFRVYSDKRTRIKLSDYINSTKVDFVNARNVVNGDVRTNGQTIAKIANRLLAVVNASLLVGGDVDLYDSAPIYTDPSIDIPSDTARIPAPAPQPTSVGIPPWTKPVELPRTEPEPTKGPGSLKTIITTILSGLGISATTALGWVEGYVTDADFIKNLLIVVVCGAFLLACVYLVARLYLKNKREERAMQIDIQKMSIAANPVMYNVDVR